MERSTGKGKKKYTFINETLQFIFWIEYIFHANRLQQSPL